MTVSGWIWGMFVCPAGGVLHGMRVVTATLVARSCGVMARLRYGAVGLA